MSAAKQLRKPPELVNVLSVRVSDAELRDLNRAIDMTGLPASAIVRYAIAHYLQRVLMEEAA